MRPMQPKALVKYLSFSLLLHALFTLGIRFMNWSEPPVLQPPIVVEVVDKLVETPPLPLVKAQAKRPKPRDNEQQVVEQEEKALNSETPEDAKYLSRNNQKVLKQTVAKNRGDFQNKDSSSSPPPRSVRARPKLKDFVPTLDPFALMKQQVVQENQHKATLEEIRQRRKNNNLADGNENSEDLKKLGKMSQSPDYLKNVDQGLETMLSTKEFKYYTYFNRIRRQLSQYWEPKVKDKLNKMFQQGRSIASEEDKITKLVIFLNPAGQLVKVQVMSESGIRDLDEAAIDAFRAASPFPNPPQGIIDSDGFVKIRWDFVLEV